MGYQLGVDLGTTFTLAAVCRDGRAEVVPLGSRTAAIPSVLFAKDDQSFLTGDAALRKGLAEPNRLAREFKRRLGDSAPLVLGGTPFAADGLLAKLLRSVVEEIERLEGGPPDHVTVCHPANWGPYKRELLDQAIRQVGLEGATTITEPEAAAVHYASTERVPVGSVIAVYDLGGGTFDAAVLKKTAEGWETLGRPDGIERLGGIDFDEAVFEHVRRSLGGRLEALDASDPAVLSAVGRLRNDCTEAKEALSSDTDTSVPVLLPDDSTEVRLTRQEFEDMIRPNLLETVEALRRAIASADLTPESVSRVLLVGGSSRIPLVAQTVGAALARPVAVDAHPKHAVALGAALAAGAASRQPVQAGEGFRAGQPDLDAESAGDVPRTRRRVRMGVVGLIAAVVIGAGGWLIWAASGEPTDATNGGAARATGGPGAPAVASTAVGATRTSACDLLTEVEAEAAVGADLAVSTVDFENCEYDSTGAPAVRVAVYVDPGEGTITAVAFRQRATDYAQQYAGGRTLDPVDGVGDEGLFRRSGVDSAGEAVLHVLAEDTMLTLALRGASSADDELRVLTQLAQSAAGRL